MAGAQALHTAYLGVTTRLRAVRTMHTMVKIMQVSMAGVAALALGAGALSAEQLQGSVQIKGSDTMVNLCQAWAEAFMAKHPDVAVAVTGGGSGTGIAALIGGSCDLAAASRMMTPKEQAQAAAKEWKVGLDGLVVVVHPKNPVRQLTLQQLAGLFTGTIQNWKDIGGPNRKVVILSREVNSGTHVYFKEHVLGKGQEFSPEALLMPSSQAIADEVATNPDAIGYYGMGYLNPKNTPVSIAKGPEGPYVAPSIAAVQSNDYPISRPLFFYSRGEPQGVVKTFLGFTLSPEGQAIVQQTDFVPIK